MKSVSPKYVPREWMLIDAYEAANKGDHSLVEELYRVFEKPFDEQPEFEAKYYKKAPQAAFSRGGCAFMS